MDSHTMLLTAETFNYSYMHYFDHLGIGHERFERLMPQDVQILEQAEEEGWSLDEVAAALETNEEIAERMLKQYRRALTIVEAENPAEAFRNGVRYSIEDAVEEGLDSPEAIEQLVVQICYRAADLAFLLDLEGEPLSRYSRHLRHEPGVGYFEGYFDEGESPEPGVLDDF